MEIIKRIKEKERENRYIRINRNILNILEIGRIITDTEKVNRFTRMEIYLKVSGETTGE